MIQRCLIIDTETTGLDPLKDAVIEIGCVLYSVAHQTTLTQFSTLVQHDSNSAEAVNRIPAAAVADTLFDPIYGEIFRAMIRQADVFVAHGAEFDQSFLPQWTQKKWVCSRFDFRWPHQSREGESLVSLALNHGIGVASAHRALTDCQLIAALFDRMADLPSMFAQAMRPKALFQALVSFDDKDKAKERGFLWQQPGAPIKSWTRRMAIEDAATLPFKTIQIGESS